MKLTNRIENGIIASLAMIVTVIIFGLYNNYFVLKPLQNELNAQRNAIIHLAEIPKYSIENDFGKMKAKDGQVVLDLDNKMPVQEYIIPKPACSDSIIKRNFWKKLFH